MPRNNDKHLSRYIRGDTEWQVQAILRASTGPSSDNLPWTGDMDYSVPHTTCSLTTQHALLHGELTVGELVTLLRISLGNASNPGYKQHTSFPVSIRRTLPRLAPLPAATLQNGMTYSAIATNRALSLSR